MTDARSRQARRTGLRAARTIGALAAGAGALAIAWGAVLPWARLTVFGATYTLPGVFGLGALTLAGACLALVALRRFALVAAACGLLALVVGTHAQRETGRALKGRLLGLAQTLAPVNDRLMRAGLPPVEPFPLGQRWSDLVGPGPLWTVCGGAALLLGAGGRWASERTGCRCSRCGKGWPFARDARVTFCPRCGERVGAFVRCPVCRENVAPGDAFCAVCQAPLG